MIAAIVNFFLGLWDVVKGLWQACWDYARTGWVWLCGLIVGVFTTAQTITDHLGTWLGDLLGLFGNLGLPSATLPSVGAAFDFANAFVPVTEIFAGLVLLCVTWVAATTYRLVKSWIPLVS